MPIEDFDYKKILQPIRRRESTIRNRAPIEEFYSDRSRILYSSSFRRLQQKAQVFSLELNSSVRTRLTHSLEVSDVGRLLATKIAAELVKRQIIDFETGQCLVAVVENSCLMHDLGNPPFGHFGEAAIREWVANDLQKIAREQKINLDKLAVLWGDFAEFDGNPQGIRMVSRLHCENDESGLNLTYPTLLCGVKYIRGAGEPLTSSDDNIKALSKKPGFFQSEKNLVLHAYAKLGIESGRRFPLTYIMEAADDISYCMSDISDGIEKGIIKVENFTRDFAEIWRRLYFDAKIPMPVLSGEKELKNFGIDVCIALNHLAVNKAAEAYVENHSGFFNGNEAELISQNSEVGRLLKAIKTFSRKYLYRSEEAESIELSGFATISGLLEHFGKLLKLPREDFNKFVAGEPEGHAYEWRIFNRISKRCVESYQNQLKEWAQSADLSLYGIENIEWWLRVHLILDHISGMTDAYALDVYQMLKGIKITHR